MTAMEYWDDADWARFILLASALAWALARLLTWFPNTA